MFLLLLPYLKAQHLLLQLKGLRTLRFLWLLRYLGDLVVLLQQVDLRNRINLLIEYLQVIVAPRLTSQAIYSRAHAPSVTPASAFAPCLPNALPVLVVLGDCCAYYRREHVEVYIAWCGVICHDVLVSPQSRRVG